MIGKKTTRQPSFITEWAIYGDEWEASLLSKRAFLKRV